MSRVQYEDPVFWPISDPGLSLAISNIVYLFFLAILLLYLLRMTGATLN